MQLNNTEYIFSLYSNLLSVDSDELIDINQLIEIIKFGYLKEEIGLLRTLSDKKEYNHLKQTQLPCVTLSGNFIHRSNKGILEHSGLIQIDIDQVNNYAETFKKLCKDPFTYVCFRSPGGNGIKIIVKINPSAETHFEQFKALEQYYKTEYNITIDPSCKDLARCMLLSYDPDLYCNPFAEVYAECYIEPASPPPASTEKKFIIHKNGNQSDTTKLLESILKVIEQNNIDLTSSYENWLRVGYALCTELNEEGRPFFHRFSANYPEYNTHETDAFYSNLLSRNNGAISMGTIIYLARQYGIAFDNETDEATKISSKPKLEINQPLQVPAEEPNQKSLMEKLKEKRTKLAAEVKLPSYCVFSNKTLELMAVEQPTNLNEFLKIKGVSHTKAEKYAQYFLPIIRRYKGISDKLELKFTEQYQAQKSVIHPFTTTEKELYEAIRKFRLEIANEERILAFHVFGNSILKEIVNRKPTTKEQMLCIKGIGEKKFNWFGSDIIHIIEKHTQKEKYN